MRAIQASLIAKRDSLKFKVENMSVTLAELGGIESSAELRQAEELCPNQIAAGGHKAVLAELEAKLKSERARIAGEIGVL